MRDIEKRQVARSLVLKYAEKIAPLFSKLIEDHTHQFCELCENKSTCSDHQQTMDCICFLLTVIAKVVLDQYPQADKLWIAEIFEDATKADIRDLIIEDLQAELEALR